MELVFGSEAIKSYKRLAYKEWYAIAEFVDNATQAYFDNHEVLDAAYAEEGAGLFVSLVYDRANDTLTIKDNSIGMNRQDLENALKIAGHHPKEGSRCKYGMGMKTSAIWFGDEWEIKTKKLGDKVELSVVIDVEKVAAGETDLAVTERPVDSEKDHYTEITIRKLRGKINGRKVGKIKQYLASIYRCDICDKSLKLTWQESPLDWEGFDARILRDDKGQRYKLDLDFEVEGKKVTGWVAVLESGGREYAGFSVFQNRRVIKGYPAAWRPEIIFGSTEGSNDLINQRITGELHLDGFEVSHTKDEITFLGNEEEELQKALLERCDPYMKKAKELRKTGDRRVPTEVKVDDAVNQVVTDLSNEEIIAALDLFEVPSPEVIAYTKETILGEVEKTKHYKVKIGNNDLILRVSRDMSPNDPYCTLDYSPEASLVIVVNLAHPYITLLNHHLTDFLRQCVFDGLAECKVNNGTPGPVHPDRIRLMKDSLLRVTYRIHDEPEDVQVEEFSEAEEEPLDDDDSAEEPGHVPIG